MKTHIEKLSESLGLSPYEARLYLAGIQMGQTSISNLARKAQLSRTAVYPPLSSLVRKGLFSLATEGRRKVYRAVTPNSLLHILDQRRTQLESLAEEISVTETIHPPDKDIDIRYFPGQNGITMASRIFLEETKEKVWYSLENPLYTVDLVGIPAQDEYVKQRVKKGIRGKMIISTDVVSPWIKEYVEKDTEQLRESLLVSGRKYPFDAQIAATSGLIIMINSKDNPFAILIRNKQLAKTIISTHKLVWNHLRPNAD